MDADKLTEIVNNHELWIVSDGRYGAKADFSRENLKGANLIDACLS
jgi:hypothetical protein